MPDINNTPIEAKRNANTGKDTDDTDNWGKFALSVLSNLVLTLFVCLVGTNCIFLARAGCSDINGNFITERKRKGNTLLDILLPTYDDYYYPNGKTNYDGTIETASSVDKFPLVDVSVIKNNGDDDSILKIIPKRLESLGLVDIDGGRYSEPKPGWMYSQYKPFKDDEVAKERWYKPFHFWQSCINWTVDSEAWSYKWERKIFKSVINKFSPSEPKDNTDNKPLQLIFLAPLLSCVIFFIIYLFSFLAPMFNNSGLWWKRALIGYMLCYSFFLSAGLGFIQTFTFTLALIGIQPYLSGWDSTMNSITNNKGTFLFLFMTLMCFSAFNHLSNTSSITFLVTSILLSIIYKFTN